MSEFADHQLCDLAVGSFMNRDDDSLGWEIGTHAGLVHGQRTGTPGS